MKKILGIFSLAIIDFSLLYIIYKYVYIACSIVGDNILNIPYEPSGMQLFFYLISLPLFLTLAYLSVIHSYYFDLKKSLCSGILVIWLAYFILISFVDLVVHSSILGNYLLYYGTLFISITSICYISYSTYLQCIQIVKSHNK